MITTIRELRQQWAGRTEIPSCVLEVIEQLLLIVEQRNVMVEALTTIQNITDCHPVDADRRDRIHQLATDALNKQ